MDAAALALALLPVGAIVVLWQLGAFADPYSRAWQAIGGTRAVDVALSRPRFRALHWVATRLDLPLQLKRAGIRLTPARFVLRAVVSGGAVLALVLAVDGVFLTRTDHAPIPPVLGLFAGAVVTALRFTEIPTTVRRRQRGIDDAMIELMVPLAIVSANGAIANRKEALILFARALDDPALARLIQVPEAYGESRDELAVDYRALVPDPGTLDDVTVFREIGQTYGSRLFLALSQAEYQVKRQRPLREALRGIADQYQGRQIDEDEEWVELARTRVNVPMSAFVLLVFIAILVPTVAIISNAIGG